MSDKADHNKDKILVARIRNDNKDAFRSLYDRYGKKIYYFSVRFLGNKEDAEDLVQTVFLNIWLNRKMLDETKEISSYIFKSAENYIYNFFRRRSMRSRFTETTIREGESSSSEAVDTIIARDLKKAIDSIIEDLPGQQKEVFKLSRTAQLTNEEIGKKLGISKRTVENHLYRALKFIRRKLY